MSYILSGDIGGTKTLLQISAADKARAPIQKKSYVSNQYPGLAEILSDFLNEAGLSNISSACFALAGPVLGRQVKLTNLPWSVDADEITARFKVPRVSLINDFEAVGLGITDLQPSDLLTLQPGKEQLHGVRLVVGAGTGLGMAWMTWQDEHYSVHPSEAGHIDFAPSDAIEYELLCYLQKLHGHVSYERIVSGPGLVAIFEFLRDSGRYAVPDRLQACFRNEDIAAVISQFAQQDNEPVALKSLELFLSAYGAFVGNMALATLPRGGIYVAGGIAAKNLSQMQQGGFLHAFRSKGRYTALLESLPLHIVTNPQVGLLGADSVARQFAIHSA